MFKKHVTVASTHQLSGKAGKDLRRRLADTYPDLGGGPAGEATLAALLPPKSTLALTKLSNRALAYGVEGGPPLFFDPDGRGALLPTVRGAAGAGVGGGRGRCAARTCTSSPPPIALAFCSTHPPRTHLQVYALAAVPTLLPLLHTWSEVSPKLLGGADLFLQVGVHVRGGARSAAALVS